MTFHRACCCNPSVFWFAQTKASVGATMYSHLYGTDGDGNEVWHWESDGEALAALGSINVESSRRLRRHGGYIYAIFAEPHANWNDVSFTDTHLVGKWDELTGELVATYEGWSNVTVDPKGLALDLFDNGDTDPDIIIAGRDGDGFAGVAAIKQSDGTNRWDVNISGVGSASVSVVAGWSLTHDSNSIWVGHENGTNGIATELTPSTGATTGNYIPLSQWEPNAPLMDCDYRPAASNIQWVALGINTDDSCGLVSDTGTLQYDGQTTANFSMHYLSTNYFARATGGHVRVLEHNITSYSSSITYNTETGMNVVSRAVASNSRTSANKIYVGGYFSSTPFTNCAGILKWDEDTETLTKVSDFTFTDLTTAFSEITSIASVETVP